MHSFCTKIWVYGTNVLLKDGFKVFLLSKVSDEFVERMEEVKGLVFAGESYGEYGE